VLDWSGSKEKEEESYVGSETMEWPLPTSIMEKGTHWPEEP